LKADLILPVAFTVFLTMGDSKPTRTNWKSNVHKSVLIKSSV
jgi:hypothetical protein